MDSFVLQNAPVVQNIMFLKKANQNIHDIRQSDTDQQRFAGIKKSLSRILVQIDQQKQDKSANHQVPHPNLF